jgi:hypothetical protein
MFCEYSELPTAFTVHAAAPRGDEAVSFMTVAQSSMMVWLTRPE